MNIDDFNYILQKNYIFFFKRGLTSTTTYNILKMINILDVSNMKSLFILLICVIKFFKLTLNILVFHLGV